MFGVKVDGNRFVWEPLGLSSFFGGEEMHRRAQLFNGLAAILFD